MYREEGALQASLLAEEVLVVDRCWRRETQFFSENVLIGWFPMLRWATRIELNKLSKRRRKEGDMKLEEKCGRRYGRVGIWRYPHISLYACTELSGIRKIYNKKKLTPSGLANVDSS